MTTDTEALRQKFERHIVATGRSEGELIFEAGHYLYPDVQEIWELYQAGYAAAKAETAAAVAKEREHWRKELHALLEAADAVATNNAHAVSTGSARYAKYSQTWKAYASLDKARQRAADAIRAGANA